MSQALHFEWDPKKAAANLARHGVSFADAVTAFADPWSITVPDPDHGPAEARFLLLGHSERDRLLVVTLNEVTAFASSAPVWRRGANARSMKKTAGRRPDPDMRPEYDFSGGIRGKYAARFREGTNVVLLDPDVASAFKSSKEVNRALRALLDATPRKRTSRKRTT